jgi:hypothetical protein
MAVVIVIVDIVVRMLRFICCVSDVVFKFVCYGLYVNMFRMLWFVCYWSYVVVRMSWYVLSLLWFVGSVVSDK